MWRTHFVILSQLTTPITIAEQAEVGIGEIGRAQPGLDETTGAGGLFLTLDAAFRAAAGTGLAPMPMTEAAIDANGLRHIYVALGEQLGERAWSIRVYYKPFVDWIWGGCILMALGGLLAISDRRYRLKRRERRVSVQLQGGAS